jgi:hypothetical protein
MDVIKEHLMYKNLPLDICMLTLTPQEQYEVIRIILESKDKKIRVCQHNSTNAYINVLLEKLNITTMKCLLEQQEHRQFDLHKEYKASH